jgi:hypothetical protein
VEQSPEMAFKGGEGYSDVELKGESMLSSKKEGAQRLEMLMEGNYEYSVESYSAGLSELKIRASLSGNPSKCFYIVFQTTLYIQLPVHWKDGDFCLSTSEKYIELTSSLNLDESAKEQLMLFTVKPIHNPDIFILCHKVFLSQEIKV